MKKVFWVAGALGMALVLSGCPIWIETDRVEVEECDWGCDAACYANIDCPDGYICNASGACVPEPDLPDTCIDDTACLDGYCNNPDDGPSGLCVDTGICTSPDDCIFFGPGLTCDERGICVPDEGPCPDGECGCVDDTECADTQLCIESRCRNLSTICVFDFECGDGGCINNECHARCTTVDDECPIGQGCTDYFCQDLEIGIDACVFDEDCGESGFRCINATCHSECVDVEECGDAEGCMSGVCRADANPIHECTDEGTECSEDMSCIRGACRMPCVAPSTARSRG